MINTKIYSQRDLRFRFKRVGFGKGNFGSVGCTTCALTGLLFTAGYDLTPPQVAERMRNVVGYSGDLIIWSKIQQAFPNVRFVYRYYKYDNSLVRKYIDQDVPVLVEVMTRLGKHWVLFLGDMKMYDPWDGRVKSTATYNPIGFALIQTKGVNGKFRPISSL
jgi:hypothetical protein